MKPYASVWLVILLLAGAAGRSAASEIARDERVIFFPTAAHLDEAGRTWRVPIHGWVFEPETDDVLRNAFLRELREALGLEEDTPLTDRLERRLRWLLVDNERGKRLRIRIGGRTHRLGRSGADGHFTGEVTISAAEAETLAPDGVLRFEAVGEADDPRRFTGVAHLVRPEGVSVVSDIDDTVKVTQVTDTGAMLANTFLREFRAVAGMAGVYRGWAERGAAFHFVSSSPHQLYEPLSAFLREAGFPEATFHLKRVRLRAPGDLRKLLADPLETKPRRIEALLEMYPRRRFALIGDSGEKDPEVYSAVARRHPDRILAIYIRDVTGEPAGSPRYEAAFDGVPGDRWRIFREAAELPAAPP